MFPPDKMTSETTQLFFEILKNKLDVSVFIIKHSIENIPCVQLLSEIYPYTFISMILYER